jgi:transcription elongation factor GreA
VSALSVAVVGLGSLVTVWDGEFEESWWIVPSYEADACQRRISDTCPLARAVLGHRVGDEVQVQRAGGNWPVTIRGIE